MTTQLALHLLGPPKLELQNAPISIDRRKALALLAFLAVDHEPHAREYLSALLWPDYNQEKAFTNLRHLLWEIQQVIGEGWILANRDSIRLISNPNPAERQIWLDVAQFESLAAEARSQTDAALRIARLTDSVSLYRSHFLTGFNLKDAPAFTEWASAKAEELRGQLVSALTTLSADLCALDQVEMAIPHARRLVSLDPLNETSHRRLMQVYVQAGQPNAALKQYQTCEKLLRNELGVDPQPETRALYKQIRKSGPASSQPLPQPTAVETRHNLPIQISTFIGREKELDELAGLISRHRLITLIGPGGIGKTRLSIRMGERLLSEFPNGVWLVELATFNGPERVSEGIATLFGLSEGSEGSLTEQLISLLRSKNILLILDNCEHLVDACAQLSDRLLRNCLSLKILTTSREALGITGEALYHVPPLELPDVQPVLDQLLEYESVRLFEERARLVQENFSLTIDNASDVIQICRRLDGLPLAIELAAARVNLLSPQQIAMRLNESLNLLSGGSRTALPRHQTIRACVDWSWNLLSESEQTLLRRLAVFAGGWTLEGAEAVGSGTPEIEVFDLLNNLIEKSLAIFNVEHERYRMLDAIRDYALERLKDAGEEEATRERHLDFFVTMAEQAEPKLLGKEQGLWMQKLNQEQENLIAAHDWCSLSKRGTSRGFRLLGGTRYYWIYAGLSKLGFKMYSEALSREHDDEKALALGLTYDGAAIYANLLGDPSLGEHAERSISIFWAHHEYVRLAMALTRKALWYVSLGDHAEAIRTYQEAIAIGRLTEDKRPISASLNNMAGLYHLHQDYEKAIALHEEALVIDREREDQTGIVLALINLAKNKLMLGDLDHQVQPLLAEAAQIVDETHLREYMQYVLEEASVLRFMRGQHFEGARLFSAAAAELRKKGTPHDEADQKFVVDWNAKMRETMGQDAFTKATIEGETLTYEQAVAETRRWLEDSQS